MHCVREALEDGKRPASNGTFVYVAIVFTMIRVGHGCGWLTTVMPFPVKIAWPFHQFAYAPRNQSDLSTLNERMPRLNVSPEKKNPKRREDENERKKNPVRTHSLTATGTWLNYRMKYQFDTHFCHFTTEKSFGMCR